MQRPLSTDPASLIVDGAPASPTPSVAETADELKARLAPERLPRHVAVIMDGNGRWAKRRGWRERIKGHEAGTESVRTITRTCASLGIEALTLYAFSRENWARPKAEVEALMRLLNRYLIDEIPEMNENKIRLVASGELDDLPAFVRRQLDATREATSRNTGMVLNLALSYGGRDEILRAARHMAREAQAGRLDPETIDADMLRRAFYQPTLPDPDLLIRTSGEMRVSNFLLWQIAYAEIHVTSVLWPDFREEHLYQALLDYQGRERRFGRVLPG
jgi:undecaprenyl diphosphate synthase